MEILHQGENLNLTSLGLSAFWGMDALCLMNMFYIIVLILPAVVRKSTLVGEGRGQRGGSSRVRELGCCTAEPLNSQLTLKMHLTLFKIILPSV